jgi:transglutaminase-like putative cysteine protease
MMKTSKLFTTRRSLLKAVPSALLLASLPEAVRAQQQEMKVFHPQPGDWRTFDITTKVNLQRAGNSTVIVPVPSVNTPWQQSLATEWTGNAKTVHLKTEGSGAQYVVAEFDGSAPATLEVTSRVRTQSRAEDWSSKDFQKESKEDLHQWLQPTALLPLDGIVKKTATQVTQGAHTDLDKVKRIYNWIIVSTYREPKVRGCGTGDVKALLESGNYGGKCADLNGLFVALCRASGVPARDAYGIRLVPSAFGYKQLGGNPSNISGAQHCRAEVYLQKHGWVAMDPADVGKVMRMETPEWIKDPDHPLVVPVRKALFGSWEGNWLAYNFAHDVKLPGKGLGEVGFLMYPQAETNGEAYDSLDADKFKYFISASQVQA